MARKQTVLEKFAEQELLRRRKIWDGLCPRSKVYYEERFGDPYATDTIDFRMRKILDEKRATVTSVQGDNRRSTKDELIRFGWPKDDS